MPDRIDIDITSVWNAIMSQLRTELGLNSSTCFWWLDDSEPPPPTTASLFVTVAPDGGTFDDGLQTGGGEHQNTVQTAVAVTVHSTVRLDTGKRDDYFLTHVSSGLGTMLTRVIQALTDFDPTFSGSPAMRELIKPQGFRAPTRIANDSIGSVTVVFDVSFDWDMTTDFSGSGTTTTTPAPTTTTTPAP